MKYFFLFMIISCATIPSPIAVTPLQQMKNICYNFSGKSRIELGDHSYVASSESIVENKHWKFALTFPLYGEEILDTSWEKFKEEGLVIHGGASARLLSGFKDYIEKKSLALDPNIILKILGYQALLVKTLSEQKNYLTTCLLKKQDHYQCPLELPQGQGILQSEWFFEENKISVTLPITSSFHLRVIFFAPKDGFFRRLRISIENQQYFTQEIFVNSCAAL